MNLVKDNLDEKKEKTKKMARIILIFILLTILALACVGAYMLYLKSTELSVYLDDKKSDAIEAKMIFKEDKSVYIPVRYFAEVLGYKTYNGESQDKSEDKYKCYVESENEIIDFSVNSQKVQKTNLLEVENKYIYEDLKYPIQYINDEMCINTEDLQVAMNTTYNYNTNTNKIEMYTLANLVTIYAKTAISYGYTGISENAVNNYSIYDDVLIVNLDKKVGAINLSTGEEILEPKYDDIIYLRETKEFLVTSDSKKGIINQEQKKIIDLKYEDISVLSEKEGIYIVKEEEKYGLVNVKGTKILESKYNQIGIDISNFKDNEIKSGYLIGNNLIPVKYEEKWLLVNTSGNLVTETTYDGLGYTGSTKNEDILNLLVIPKYNAIVVRKDSEKIQKYTLLGPDGTEIYPSKLDDIYLKIEDKKKSYVIVMGENIYDAEVELEKKGLKSVIDDGDGEKINEDINKEDNKNSQNNEENTEE